MPNNDLGTLRRSGIVGTFGPGAIVDFRSSRGAAVSAVVAGLEEWDRNAAARGTFHPQCVFEERLERKLQVRGFRLPPVNVDVGRGRIAEKLVGVRFPQWLLCPHCNVLRHADTWGPIPGDPAPYCGDCTTRLGGQTVYPVPVRFVVACKRGHLDEFPWHRWVQHREVCTHKGDLTLTSQSAGLAGLILACKECGARRSMDGAFRREALSGLPCRGLRPWLPAGDEVCTESEPPRVVQRGASNLYFPVIQSALSIPPFNDGLRAAFGTAWAMIEDLEGEEREKFVRKLSETQNLAGLHLTPDELITRVNQQIEILNRPETANFRWQEYLQFTLGGDRQADDGTEFEIRSLPVPEQFRNTIGQVVQVQRLREVRAITGFTRIDSPEFSSPGGGFVAPLSKSALDWLPGIEVRGEGVFISLSNEAVDKWESLESVDQHCRSVRDAYATLWRQRTGDQGPPPRDISARLLLVHSIAHALMRQLSLDCGYSMASLRERLYVSRGSESMCGLLVYTATTDSDGTLGGLARQAMPERFEGVLASALEAMRWCSSDPICYHGHAAASEGLNIAACHSCLLAPETSCEEFNHFLDRVALFGLPEDPTLGFFSR